MNRLMEWKGMALLLLSAVAIPALAEVTVTDVGCRQRWPWNNLVDIDFSVAGTEAGKVYRIDVRATTPSLSDTSLVATSFVSEPVIAGDGTFRAVWDFGKDFPETAVTGLVATVSLAPIAETDPLYLVLDLSAGAEASYYPSRYTFAPPDLSDDRCRTDELWLKKCPACTFTMGWENGQENTLGWLPAHRVTLTKPYYLGVFEVTQQQFANVTGKWPSFYVCDREGRPVERLYEETASGKKYPFDMIRGGLNDWPSGTSVGSDSFLGRIRARSGLSGFDLPTEAQWECACRGGTTTAHYVPEMNEVTSQKNKVFGKYLRYAYDVNGSPLNSQDPNCELARGSAKVGSYPPNPWGFYDMYGNVMEMCLDKWVGYYIPNYEERFKPGRIDPTGYPNNAEGDGDRVGRGSDFSRDAETTYSSYRRNFWRNDYARYAGFRLCLNIR